MPVRRIVVVVLLAVVAASASACADGGEPGAPVSTIVVTSSILGDVVEAIVGDQAEVVTIVPAGADPHEFQASARDVAAIGTADLVVVNGGGFEEGLDDVIDAAAGDDVTVFAALDAVDVLGRGDGDHDHGHDDGGVDPHFFTDPTRMARAVEAMAAALAGVDGIEPAVLAADTDSYLAELAALDAEVADLVASLPAEARILVTSHDVLGYFADRYGFEVVGTAIPGSSSSGDADASRLAELADVVAATGVGAVFADTSGSDDVVSTLAAEVGEVEVVDLYTEALGPPDSDGATYLDMVRTNAVRIVEALR